MKKLLLSKIQTIMKHAITLTITLILFNCIAFGQSGNLLIENINIIDVETGKVKTSTVLVENGKIKNISKNISAIDGIEVIDGTGKWLMPGMVDAHIHLFQSGGVYTRPDVLDLTEYVDYNKEVKWVRNEASDILKRYLRCGITTVIDEGGPMSNFDIRNENSDNSSYPNIIVTGPLISPYQPERLNVEDPPIIEVHNEEEARAEVIKQIPFKPDFIKIWYLDREQFPADSSFKMVKAVIEESHANDLKVAVHATQLKTAKLAMKAGADFLVHSVDDEIIDDEFINLMLNNKVSYIPTLLVNNNYLSTFMETREFTKEDFAIAPPFPLGSYFDLKIKTNEKLERIQNSEEILANIAKHKHKSDSVRAYNLILLNKNGVNIATGTDAGNIGTYHASSYYDEIACMKKYGMSNLDILKASTINGAKILNKENEFGTIEVGKMADIVILNSNPLMDLSALKEIEYVIKNGKLHYVDSIIIETPENLVQMQVNGYNARNIDAFLEPYSDDFEIYKPLNMFKKKGKENVRDGYINLFANVPDLHVEIVNRTVHGNIVIDKERITGLPEGKIIEAIAIYEIENGKIVRVYFPKSIIIDNK